MRKVNMFLDVCGDAAQQTTVSTYINQFFFGRGACLPQAAVAGKRHVARIDGNGGNGWSFSLFNVSLDWNKIDWMLSKGDEVLLFRGVRCCLLSDGAR